MATQDEARQAILDAIAEWAPQVGNTEGLKDLAEAYSLVEKREKSAPERAATIA